MQDGGKLFFKASEHAEPRIGSRTACTLGPGMVATIGGLETVKGHRGVPAAPITCVLKNAGRSSCLHVFQSEKVGNGFSVDSLGF